MKLTRRAVVGGIGASAISGCRTEPPATRTPPQSTGTSTTTTPTTAARKPNIVYIYSDQHRGNLLGAAGDPVAITPVLDGLAAESVLFTESFTCSPLCRPARITMMTGQYVWQHAIDNNLDTPDPTMASHVRRLRDEAGYFTMVIGKTDFYDEPGHTLDKDHRAIHTTFGFSDSIELLGQTEQTWRGSEYSDWLTATTPKGERDKYDRYTNYLLTYDWFSPPPDVDPWLLSTYDHMDQYCARRAVDWIQTAPTDQPFYLQVNFPGPHKPFNATTEFRALYEKLGVEFPPAILELPAAPGTLVTTLLGVKFEEWNEDTIQDLKLAYYATISLVDQAIGQVLDALEAAGRLEDTWIIYHSDHGELLGDHFLTGKIAFYEGALRVPLMIRPPGGRSARTSSALVGSVDVTATLLEIAGLAPTVEVGTSLLPRVASDDDSGLPGRSEVVGGDLGYYFLRTASHKIEYDPLTDSVTELYDLVGDPEERVNLVADASAAPIRDELLERLRSYLEAYPPTEV
jgi:arylsulfatase